MYRACFWLFHVAVVTLISGCQAGGSTDDGSDADGGPTVADGGPPDMALAPGSNLCAAESGCGGDPTGSWLEGPGCAAILFEAAVDFNGCPAVESTAEVDMRLGGALVLDVDGSTTGSVSIDVNVRSLYELACLGTCDWMDCEVADEAHCLCFETLPVGTVGSPVDGNWAAEDGALRAGIGDFARAVPYCVTEEGLALDLDVGGLPVRVQLHRGVTSPEFGARPAVVHIAADAGPVSIVSGGEPIAEDVGFGQVGIGAPVSVGDVLVGVRGENIAVDASEPVRAGRNSRALFFLWDAGDELRLDGGIGAGRRKSVLNTLAGAGPLHFTAFSDGVDAAPVTGRLEPGEKMLVDPEGEFSYLAVDLDDDGNSDTVFSILRISGPLAFARKPDGEVGLLHVAGDAIQWAEADIFREAEARITNFRDEPVSVRAGDAEIEVMPGATGFLAGLTVGTITISARADDGQWVPVVQQIIGDSGLEAVFYGDDAVMAVPGGSLSILHLGGGLGPVDVLSVNSGVYGDPVASALQPNSVVGVGVHPYDFRGVVPMTRPTPDLLPLFATGRELHTLYLMTGEDGQPSVWSRDRDNRGGGVPGRPEVAPLVEVEPLWVPTPTMRILVAHTVGAEAIPVSVDGISLGRLAPGSISPLVSVPFSRFRVQATLDGRVRFNDVSAVATGMSVRHVSGGRVNYGLTIPFTGAPQVGFSFIDLPRGEGWRVSGDGCVADLQDHVWERAFPLDPEQAQFDLCHDRDADGTPDAQYPIFDDGRPPQPVGLALMQGAEPGAVEIWAITVDDAWRVEAVELPLME